MYCEAQLGTVGEPFYENWEAESPCAEAVRHEWDISNAGSTCDLYSPVALTELSVALSFAQLV